MGYFYSEGAFIFPPELNSKFYASVVKKNMLELSFFIILPLCGEFFYCRFKVSMVIAHDVEVSMFV